MTRGSLALRWHRGLNAFLGAVWLVGVLKLLSPVRLPLVDTLVVPALFAAFFVVPVGVVAVWIVGRRSGRLAPSERTYGLFSKLFWAVSWLVSCVPVLFLVALYQPWPLSLQYGPDTAYSRSQFQRLYGAEPPPSVSSIYYRWYGLRDGTCFMRFDTRERAVVDRMVERLRLEPVEPPGPVAVDVEDWRPGWWLEIEPSAEWRGRSEWERLWYDEERGAAFYLSVTF